jgi:hypothetical protein
MNGKKKMICKYFMCTSQPLPQLPLPSGIMTKVAMVAGMEVIHKLSNVNFHLLRLICPWPLMNAQSASITD